MSQPEFNYESGREAAELGMARADAADRVKLWKKQALDWLMRQPIGAEIRADDLIAAIGVPDTGANRVNVVGAWFSAQSKLGYIKWTGRFTNSRRVTRHTGMQRVWVINDWLTTA